MLRIKLFKGKHQLLDTPVLSEREFFKVIYELQCNIKGTAKAFLFLNNQILHSVTLGVPPCRVFNSVANKWCDFKEFIDHPNSFAFIDRLKHAYWIKDKIVLSTLFS